MDSMPAEATTQIRWISTKTMVAADGLTKSMKAEQLDRLMKTGWLNVEFQERLTGASPALKPQLVWHQHPSFLFDGRWYKKAWTASDSEITLFSHEP